MKIGAFMMPNNPPHRSILDGHRHNLDYISFLDKIGFDEVWIGEHYTTPWEPCPSPDLLIAQAIDRTSNIKLATGAFLLPYHHPAELAHRIAYLDHMSEGRLIVGLGAGGFPGDLELFNIDGASGENRDMMAESIDIMIKLWTSDEAFSYKGKYWTVKRPADDSPTKCHLKPYQKPYPLLGIAALSPRSSSMTLAGEKGYMPLNLGLSNHYLKDNWDDYERAANKAGLDPDRSIWRLGRDMFIADTDAEARKLALEGPIGKTWREYLLPLFAKFRMLDVMKHKPDVADSDVTVEYLADHNWLVGSPSTVSAKLAAIEEESGGFGCLLISAYDHLEHLDQWRQSKTAFIDEVAPKFA
jgi:alkanesulfonate monooxygenase SsuD/methylene tetrahydromethanopterin reductase-like flavin-dependent oxidoreductase (luciferase family)